MIRALLFDFGGTLDGPAHWLDRFLAGYRAAGFDLSREELDSAFSFATQAGYRAAGVMRRFGLVETVRFLVGNQFEFLRKGGAETIRSTLEHAGARGRYQKVEEITGTFADRTSAGLAESRSVLLGLEPRFRLGVVSNFYGNLDRVLAEARLDKVIDAVIDSSRIGVFKPDPGIYRAALNAMKVAPDGAAMIGDSPEKDLAPARALGMRAVWFNPSGRRVEASADHTIQSLRELDGIEW